MIFDVQIGYGIEARLRGRAGVKPYKVAERVPVKIEEVSLDDAPVAFWWHPTALSPKRSWSEREACPAKVAVRIVDGVLYQPVTQWKHECRSIEPSDDFVRMVKRSKNKCGLMDEACIRSLHEASILFSSDGDLSPIDHGKPDVDMAMVKDIRHSSRDAALAKIADHYARFRMIGGIAHVRTVAPIIRMELGSSYSGRFDLVEPHHLFSQPWNVHPLPDFAKAKKIFRKSHGSTLEPNWKLLEPEILIPEAIDVDVHRLMVRNVAHSMLKHLGTNRSDYGHYGSYIAQDSVEAVIAYGELRDAMDAKDTSTAELLRLTEALSEVASYTGDRNATASLKARLEADGFEFAPEFQGPRP